MSKTIEVTPKQASELLAEGYTVRCYLELSGPPKAKPKPTKVFTPPDAMIALSLEHGGPTKGKMRVIWERTRKALWEKDATAVYTKARIEGCLKTQGNADSGMFAYLLRTGCLRRVEKDA